jgi:hypothetical protein
MTEQVSVTLRLQRALNDTPKSASPLSEMADVTGRVPPSPARHPNLPSARRIFDNAASDVERQAAADFLLFHGDALDAQRVDVWEKTLRAEVRRDREQIQFRNVTIGVALLAAFVAGAW